MMFKKILLIKSFIKEILKKLFVIMMKLLRKIF